jgi:hypothetical protein
MEQSSSWEADSHSASQEIPTFQETEKLITMFMTPCHQTLS